MPAIGPKRPTVLRVTDPGRHHPRRARRPPSRRSEPVPTSVLALLACHVHAVQVRGQQQQGHRVHAQERGLRRAASEQHRRDQHDQHDRLEQVGHRRGGVLEVDPAVGHVGDGEERRLRRDATDRVADREPGLTLPRGDHAGQQPRQRRRRAEQDRAGDRLAKAGAVGDLVNEASELLPITSSTAAARNAAMIAHRGERRSPTASSRPGLAPEDAHSMTRRVRTYGTTQASGSRRRSVVPLTGSWHA